jgi:hypothetical protein
MFHKLLLLKFISYLKEFIFSRIWGQLHATNINREAHFTRPHKLV